MYLLMKSLIPILLIFCIACQAPSDTEKNNQTPDLIIHNASIYTATGDTTSTAIAIKGDKILQLGSSEILGTKTTTTQLIDAKGQYLMPGFIEGHGHFSGLGETLQNLNFLTDTTWAQALEKVKAKVATAQPGEWIYGRGWHQEKWTESPQNSVGGYPTHETLSELSPDNPVMLVHASGHSLYANEQAMRVAGITKESPDPKGGKIIRDGNKRAIGVFEERAMTPIKTAFNDYKKNLDVEEQKKLWYKAIDLAQQECLENGITSFQDAGAKFWELDRYKQMAEDGAFDIRLWSMVRHSYDEMKDNKLTDYRQIGIGNNHFTCRAIKTEVDGALGAHGAWLLEPYADKPDFYGQNTTDVEEVARIASLADKHNMQLCVHAIGDRANKEVLDIIEKYNTNNQDQRWRIEHAQHLNPTDIQRFKSTGAIASMQAVHCTSDAPFVVKRLGQLRAKIGAYAWKALLNTGVTIVNGTDVPVEDIDPIKNFYATVTRTRTDNGMRFFVENKMSREQALRSYTIDAAYGAFEEDIKGSLEAGKLADLVLLSENLMTCGDLDILGTKVLMTIVGGEVKYKSGDGL